MVEEEIADLSEEEAEEVRGEFFYTTLLTLTILVGLSGLATCQFIQSRRKYNEEMKTRQEEEAQFNTSLLDQSCNLAASF